jgi:hypothetical protein
MSKSITRGTATFDDYKAMHPKLVASLEKKYGSPLPDEYQKYLLDTATASVMNGENLGTWMNRSVVCVDRIVNGSASYSDYPLFWICVFGIIDEYYNDLMSNREFTFWRELCAPIYEAMDKLHSKLTEEDFSIIKFMRNSYCHVKLDYIWHKVKVKSGKIVAIKSPPDPCVRNLVVERIEAHGGDQQAMAHSFALLLEKEIASLRNAVIEVMAIK